jgi:hypothetical protein
MNHLRRNAAGSPLPLLTQTLSLREALLDLAAEPADILATLLARVLDSQSEMQETGDPRALDRLTQVWTLQRRDRRKCNALRVTLRTATKIPRLLQNLAYRLPRLSPVTSPNRGSK